MLSSTYKWYEETLDIITDIPTFRIDPAYNVALMISKTAMPIIDSLLFIEKNHYTGWADMKTDLLSLTEYNITQLTQFRTRDFVFDENIELPF